MVKRAVAGLLWFVTGLFAAELVEYFTGASRLMGPLLALTIAMFVVLDPLHVMWASRDSTPRSELESAGSV
ncbi:MAG: hypothetical protein ACJ765_10860 [Chloroflexota bacterium]